MPAYALIYILAILGLEILLVGLIWLWWRALKQQQEAFNHATQDTYAELTQIIKKTTQEAEKVMAEALKTAAHLQLAAHTHVERIEQQTEDLMTKQSTWHEETLRRLLTEYQQNVHQGTTQNLQLVQDLIQDRLQTLDTSLAQELHQTNVVVKETLQQQLESAQTEIEAYKNEQIKKIDQQSQSIVHTVVRDMLGKSLSPADHRHLVKNQLTQALIQIKTPTHAT